MHLPITSVGGLGATATLLHGTRITPPPHSHTRNESSRCSRPAPKDRVKGRPPATRTFVSEITRQS